MATLRSRNFTKLEELYAEPQKNVSSLTARPVLIPFPSVSPAATQTTAAQLLKMKQWKHRRANDRDTKSAGKRHKLRAHIRDINS